MSLPASGTLLGQQGKLWVQTWFEKCGAGGFFLVLGNTDVFFLRSKYLAPVVRSVEKKKFCIIIHLQTFLRHKWLVNYVSKQVANNNNINIKPVCESKCIHGHAHIIYMNIHCPHLGLSQELAMLSVHHLIRPTSESSFRRQQWHVSRVSSGG